MAIDGQQVSVRPRSALAEMSSCGPWQIAATGLPAVHRVAREVDHRVAHAHLVGRVAAGNHERVEVLHPRGAGGEVGRDDRVAALARDTPRRAVGPTIVTVAPAARSASSGPVSSRSSNSSSTSIATRLPDSTLRRLMCGDSTAMS